MTSESLCYPLYPANHTLNRFPTDSIIAFGTSFCYDSIGHGFGLPHTDENQYNTNMGNCLDYTIYPASNMYPGDVNFERLESMYLNGEGIQDNDNNDQKDDKDDDEGDDEDNNDERYLRKVIVRHYVWADSLPEETRRK